MAPAPAPRRVSARGLSDGRRGLTGVALLVIVFLPLLSGAAAQSDDDEGGAAAFDVDDEWADIQGVAIGDHWEYRSTGDARGTVRNEVVAIGNFTGHFDKTYLTYRIDSVAELQVEQGPQEEVTFSTDMRVDSQKWVRYHDYGTVEVRGNITIEGTRETTTVIAYDPALVEDIYPYQEGFEWKGTADRYQRSGEEEAPEDDYVITGKVEGRETIRVPAGTFETWRVRYQHHGAGYSIRWFSEEVCELVREETYERSGELRSTVELESFSCSHEVKERPIYDGREVALIKGEPRPFDRDGDGEDDGQEMIVGGENGGSADDKQSPGVPALMVVASLGLAALASRRPRTRT